MIYNKILKQGDTLFIAVDNFVAISDIMKKEKEELEKKLNKCYKLLANRAKYKIKLI